MKTRLLVALCCLSAGSFALADDSPQFRGPDRTGVSKEKGLLQAWPKAGPTLTWTFKDAGLGFSTVAVAKGVIYTLGTDAKFTEEQVIAIDEKSGKELWRTKLGPLYTIINIVVKDGKKTITNVNAYGDGPRSTPTIDGNFLYALGGEGQLVCVDVTKKGAEVWRKHLVKDLGGVIMDKYGFSESPLVDGKLLLCTPGGPNGTLAALDKTDGKVIWRSKGLTNYAPFSSIVIAEFHGVRQYVQTSYHDDEGDIHGAVSGFAAKDGKVLWNKPIFTGANDGIGTSPVIAGNSVYVTAGFGGGCHLFEIDEKQKATEKFSKKAQKNVKNAHGGVVLVDGHIYGHSERDKWVCQDLATGDVKWDETAKLKAPSGAITAADGKLYLFADDGKVGLVDADPKGFNLISSFELPVKSTIPKTRVSHRFARMWAYPVIANGHLYLRDHEYIFAFKITK